MTAKTLTISLPQELLGFLDENPTISPSKLFQTALINCQDSLKHNPQLIEANKEIQRLNKVCGTLQKHLLEATNFIEEEKLMDKFLK